MSGSNQVLPSPENLVDLFEESVKKHSKLDLFGTKNSTKDDYDWVTYGETAERVDNLRAGLAQLGIGKGDGVGIIANNRSEWAVAAYATYGLGARFVPMYEAELVRIMKYIIEDSGVKVLLVARDDILEKVEDFPNQIKSLENIYVIEGNEKNSIAELERIGKEKPVASQKPQPEDIAGLIYTSGTTGNPKGVLLSHKNLSSNAIAAASMLPEIIGVGDCSLSFLPWAHSFGQTAELHMLIYIGGKTGFAEGPKTIVDDLALVRPTILVAVPRVFSKVYTGLKNKMDKQGGLPKFLFNMGLAAAAEKRKMNGSSGFLNAFKLKLVDKLVYSKVREKFGNRMKMSLSSSAALNPKIGDFFEDIGIPVYEAWGMTELSPGHTANTLGESRRGSVGRPFPGCSVKIDKTYTGGEKAKDGEVIAYGPNVMMGYHNLPEATSEVLREDGGLHTGDRGWVDDDGYLFITGRIKEQYKLENGKYVFPVAIEEAIKLSIYVENAMVYGANRAYNVVVMVPDWLVMDGWVEEQGLSGTHEELVNNPKFVEFMESELQRTCKDIANYEKPKKILLLSEPFSTENGILTPTLKLKRREVHKIYGSRIDSLFEDM